MMNKKKIVMSALLAFTLTASMFSTITVHATDSIPDDTTANQEIESDVWEETVYPFVQYMLFVNWQIGNDSQNGLFASRLFEEMPQANDAAFLTFYNEDYYEPYYVEESKEFRIPYDVLANDAKKYYKNVPDLKTMNTPETTLHYDSATNEFVWRGNGGSGGTDGLRIDIVKVNEVGNGTYGIQFKVAEKYDENNNLYYGEYTLVVEENGNNQYRYVSFLKGYQTLPEQPTYLPTLTLASSTWTGENDIVFNTETKGGTVELAEMNLYKDEYSIGSINVTPEKQLDTEGNGTLVFHNDDLKNAKLLNSNEEVDWTKVEEIEITFNYELDGAKVKDGDRVSVDFKTSTDTIQISNSGVTMILPESAPANLELKVTLTSGADEKSAVEKMAKIDGDKIKTFDLSLVLNGVVYEYNRQFTSTISLPIPEGWDKDKLALYYYNEETNEVESVTFTVDSVNETVVFDTNHFSKYVLIQKDTTTDETTQNTNTPTPDAGKNETTQNTSTPKTSDETNVSLYATILITSTLAAAIFFVLKKKGLKA